MKLKQIQATERAKYVKMFCDAHKNYQKNELASAADHLRNNLWYHDIIDQKTKETATWSDDAVESGRVEFMTEDGRCIGVDVNGDVTITKE
jgi:hypothetical protein